MFSLDPRMKNLSYLSETQREELIEAIYDEATIESETEVLDSEKDECNDKDVHPPPSKKSKNGASGQVHQYISFENSSS